MNSVSMYLNQRDLTHKSVYGQDREFLAAMGQYPFDTDAGVAVNHYNALTHNPVWAAVQLISGDVSKLPLNLYQRQQVGEKSRDLATGHPVQQLVRWQVNPYMSAFRFWRRMMTHVLLWNRAYAVIERDEQFRPVGLWPLLPDRTTHYYLEDTPVYIAEIGGKLVTLDDADVLDLQGICIDDAYPEQCDLVRNARDNWSLGLAAQKFGAKFFRNGANQGGILEIPPGFTEKAADNLVEGVYRKHTHIDNAFKTMILRDGAKFHSTQVEPEKSQLHETRKEAVNDVARWYSIPNHKLGGDTNTSYSSLEQENRSYLDSCLQPWLTSISSQCWMKLLSEVEKQSGLWYLEHNVNAFLATDTLTQYQVGQIAIQTGVMSPDEFRATQNMNPREDGLGGEYYFSNNMQPAGQMAQAEDTELLDSTRQLFEQSVKRVREKTTRAIKRRAKTKPDEPFGTQYSNQFSVDLIEYARPLALLTGLEPETVVARSAAECFEGIAEHTTLASALIKLEPKQ